VSHSYWHRGKGATLVWSGWCNEQERRNRQDKPERHPSDESRGRLLGLQVVELVDELLELGHGVVALVGAESLIDGEGHGLDCGAHLAVGVLIGLGGGLVRIDEHGAQFLGDALGRAGLMEDGQKFLLPLFSVRDPDLLGIGEREAPFADLCLLVFGQGPQPVFQPVDGGMRPLLEPLWRGGLHEGVALSWSFCKASSRVRTCEGSTEARKTPPSATSRSKRSARSRS
jgi:hypothetical protein